MKVFISLPYTGSDEITEERYHAARVHAEELIRAGLTPVSPILCFHPFVKNLSDVNTETWHLISVNQLKGCDRVDVLCLPGWEKSAGVKIEVDYAHNNNIQVTYRVSPGDVYVYLVYPPRSD